MTEVAGKPRTAAVVMALAAVYVIWGSTYLAIRVGLHGYPPFAMGALRFLAAGVAMYAFLRWRGHAPPTRAQWRNVVVLSVFLLVTGNGLVNVAEQTVSSGLAAVAVASMPLWAALFGRLRGQHPSRGELIGLAIGFVGVVWLNAGSEMRASVVGMVALLVAPISWAWGSVWSRGRDLPGAAMSTAAQMVSAGVGMAAIAVVLGERFAGVPPLSSTLAVAYLAVFGSIVAFSAYVWLLEHVRPALATSYAYVNPPIAVLLGAALLGERFGAQSIGAMAVVLAGVVIVMRAKAKPRA